MRVKSWHVPLGLWLAVILAGVLVAGTASPAAEADAQKSSSGSALNGDPRCEYAGEWGNPNPMAGFIHSISAVAVGPNGNVYVAEEFDVAKHQIQVFDRAGKFLRAWGERPYPGRAVSVSTEAELSSPHEIAVAPDGTVYVAVFDGRVRRFTPDGKQLGSWVLPEVDDDTFYPQDMAVAPDGTVYVVGGGRVQYFSPEGEFLGKWGKFGLAKGEFADPCSVAVAPDGTVYAADMAEGGVQYFTANGSFLGKWGYDGPREERFLTTALDVGPDGDVFVAGYRMAEGPWPRGGRLVFRFGPTGALKGILRLRRRAGIAFYPAGPGIAVGPDGTIYVAERDWGRVSYYKPVGLRRRLSMLLGSAILLAAVAITAVNVAGAAGRRLGRRPPPVRRFGQSFL
ncbi:MAG: NHL repeat-containing protein [bacterium]